jgi:hypothetical protein
MKIYEIIIAFAVVSIFFISRNSYFVNNALGPAADSPVKSRVEANNYAGERVLYLISPLGRAEYNNLGLVDLNGEKVNLITLRTKILLVDDLEKIYSQPGSLLPLRIERTVSSFFGKVHSTEEYDQKRSVVIMRKFKGKKLVKEQIIKANAPVQNVIMLLFYLRDSPDLKIGWSFTVRVPAEFKPELVSIKLELVSIDEIKVTAGKFKAYHFISIPKKFEFWINKDDPRIPLKLKIKSIIDFNVLMKKYISNTKLSKIEGKK